VLGTTPPQHSVFRMEAQAMAMTTIHTTLWGMILIHHLVWHMKGKVTTMTTDRIIQLLTSLPPHSVIPMSSQATTLTTIRIIVSRTILLQLSAYTWPHAIGRRKSTSNNLRKRPDRAKLIICESLRKITASIVRNGTRFITSTLVSHLVRVGPAADLMRRTLTRTRVARGNHCKGTTKHVVIRMLEFRSKQFCILEKIFCRCALAATHICSFQVYLLCFYFPMRGI
jgi:hypothetical protein